MVVNGIVPHFWTLFNSSVERWYWIYWTSYCWRIRSVCAHQSSTAVTVRMAANVIRSICASMILMCADLHCEQCGWTWDEHFRVVWHIYSLPNIAVHPLFRGSLLRFTFEVLVREALLRFEYFARRLKVQKKLGKPDEETFQSKIAAVSLDNIPRNNIASNKILLWKTFSVHLWLRAVCTDMQFNCVMIIER